MKHHHTTSHSGGGDPNEICSFLSNEIVGILCIIFGTLSVLFGFKFRHSVLGIFGSGLGSFISYFIILYFKFDMVANAIISFFISLVLCFCCVYYKRFGVGLLSILTASSMITMMGVSQMGTFGQIVTYILLGLIPATFVTFPEIALLFATSFYGSWMITFGIDAFLRVGFPNPLYSVAFLYNWQDSIVNVQAVFVLLLLMTSLFTNSIFIQIYWVNKLHIHNEILIKDHDMESENNNETTHPQLIAIDDDLYEITITSQDPPYVDPTVILQPTVDQSCYQKDKESQFIEESKPLIQDS
ncbi:hypothetical protein DLAC_04693 [Tieghemostelium lacteum]|uniref:TM7S3/TM198-like domain-containing protein n=1 Tax=Tieghemostelium lacteum TaxID=361077 RepID=A0A151ZKF1_TIELA|nr:hypothetical protein DLAC_04693 [Tieghemostelium lacteum]|eukprot:KYQ94395.1 hypothetical protein DLAC_04693 [Tieghemostelium lacteum]